MLLRDRLSVRYPLLRIEQPEDAEMAKNQEKSWSELPDFTFNKFVIDMPPVSNEIYANGLQQAPIGIELRIISRHTPDEYGNEGPVTLSASELASVRLVQFRGGAALPGTWQIADESNGYEPHPGTVRGLDSGTHRAASAPGTYFPDRYVSTTAAPQELKMALAITRDDGRVFITNGSQPDDGLLEASITLLPVTVPVYDVGNYSFEKLEQEGNFDLFVHVYYLGVRDNMGETLKLRSGAPAEPAGMIQWRDKVPGITQASYAGHAQPGQSAVTWNMKIAYGAHQPSAKVNVPSAERMAFVLVGRNDIPFHADSAINHNAPMVANPRDQFGNPHAIRVKFKGSDPEGRLELVMEKA